MCPLTPEHDSVDILYWDTEDWIVAFGKHRGRSFYDLPPDYVQWCLDNLFTDAHNSHGVYLFIELANDMGIYSRPVPEELEDGD